MSLNAITTKIKQDAEAEAESVLAQANEKVSVISKETDRLVSDIRAEVDSRLEKERSHKEAVVRSLEKQRASIALQTAKRQIIDKVFDQAFTELLTLSGSEYVDFMVAKYKTLVPADMDIKDVLASKAKETETAEIIKTLGLKATVTVSDRLQAGCVFVGSDFEFDLSLENLFAQARAASEMEIANTLFSGK
ncbi:MAG: hypothetical protein H6779_01110 [Candidatus Nomurabacteria bacterium]|nr:hypothetical protein [Candidatus Nomurabacteria bacterium]USN88028.1 MAG: hypothetical protein H6779_01110 [Candidatus Nomurabacteria bacterium]